MPLTRAVLPLAVLLSATAAQCGRAAPSEPPAAPARGQPAPQPATAMRALPTSAHLHSSTNSPLTEPEVRVIRDAAAWASTWRELQAGLAAGPAPAVDFAREMVVVVALGQRPSGGHDVRVDAVAESGDGGLVLRATRTSPGAGCMSTAVMTAPVDVVRVPRAPGAVRLEPVDVAQPC